MPKVISFIDRATKEKQCLGMPSGTASGRLKKLIFFQLIKELRRDVCFRCSACIDSCEELSVEHKIDWRYDKPELFWDLNNIAFSHRKCNKPRPQKLGLRTVTAVGMSWCYKCKSTKPLDAFFLQTRQWNGISEICKPCKSIQNKRRIRQ